MPIAFKASSNMIMQKGQAVAITWAPTSRASSILSTLKRFSLSTSVQIPPPPVRRVDVQCDGQRASHGLDTAGRTEALDTAAIQPARPAEQRSAADPPVVTVAAGRVRQRQLDPHDGRLQGGVAVWACGAWPLAASLGA